MSSSGLRLVVVPTDPIAAYERAGYDWLERYYNPTGMFEEVFALSPLEQGERTAFGMTIRGVSSGEFSQALRAIRPHVVRAYGGHWPADLVCRHRLHKVPVVVSVHDKRRKLVYDAVRYADVVICVSKAVEAQVHSVGANRKRIRVLPNRVDPGIFHPVTDKESLEAVAGRFPPGKHILHVGRKDPIKNLDTLVKAIALLSSEYSCVFVGRGDAAPYALLAEQLGVSSRCFWIESVTNSDLPAWYSWCDCFCLPSRSEAFPIVSIEAAACGAAIVTSDIGPMNEYLTHDVSACLVSDYENPRALSDAIRKVCENPDYREVLRTGAIKASTPFDRNVVDAAEAAIYGDAIRMRSPTLARRLEITAWNAKEELKSRLHHSSSPVSRLARKSLSMSLKPLKALHRSRRLTGVAR